MISPLAIEKPTAARRKTGSIMMRGMTVAVLGVKNQNPCETCCLRGSMKGGDVVCDLRLGAGRARYMDWVL